MDAGVVAGLLQVATQGGLLAEKTYLLKSVASKRPATASGCGGARNATHTLFQQPARTQAARDPVAVHEPGPGCAGHAGDYPRLSPPSPQPPPAGEGVALHGVLTGPDSFRIRKARCGRRRRRISPRARRRFRPRCEAKPPV